jgi:hypothetical protein
VDSVEIVFQNGDICTRGQAWGWADSKAFEFNALAFQEGKVLKEIADADDNNLVNLCAFG